jgi:WD40 repeat protein
VLVDLRAFGAGHSNTGNSNAGVSSGLGPAEQNSAGAGQPVAAPEGQINSSPTADRPTLAGSGILSDASAERPDRGRRRTVVALAVTVGLPAIAGGFWFALGRHRKPNNERSDLLGMGHSGEDGSRPVEIRQFRDHSSEVNCFALTPDETLLIVGDRTNKLSVWDFRLTEQRKSFRAHSGPIRRIIMTADGKFAVTASADQTLKLWDVATWKQLTQFNGHIDAVTSVVQVPGRDEIVSSSFDGRLRRWSLDKGTPLAWYGDKPVDESERADASELDPQTFEQHVAWVRDLVIPAPGAIPTPGVIPVRGNQIISAGNDRVILIWDLESARMVDRLVEHRAPVMCLAVTPDGSRLLSGGYDKTLCLWDLGARRLIRHLPHASATPASLAFSPGGMQALSGGADGLIHVWDVATGNELHVLEGHEGTVTSLHFTADGRHFVSGGEDRTVRVWRLPQDLSATSAL